MKAKIVLLLLFFLLPSGCAPRGETDSLDSILEYSRQRYSAVSKRGLDAELSNSLVGLTKLMEEVVASPSVLSERSEKISEMFSELYGRAGFTIRPVLGELINQYGAESTGSREIQVSRAKLLVARSYSILSAELETTRFSL